VSLQSIDFAAECHGLVNDGYTDLIKQILDS
jgi:hypothetical protein